MPSIKQIVSNFPDEPHCSDEDHFDFILGWFCSGDGIDVVEQIFHRVNLE